MTVADLIALLDKMPKNMRVMQEGDDVYRETFFPPTQQLLHLSWRDFGHTCTNGSPATYYSYTLQKETDIPLCEGEWKEEVIVL